jgi:RimJ/RimL family protein N-acetyltransferase
VSSIFRPATEVPVLETQRLTLRAHRLEDFKDCVALWVDPIVTRYISGKPCSEEETWSRFLRYIGHWSVLGYGYWVIEEKHSGNYIGELGFADYKRDVEPSIQGTPELGWALVSSAHGKGYATEAVRAAIAWGESHFAKARTVCLIHPENLASIRVAEKCGYKEFQRAIYKGHTTLLFER